VEKPADSHTVLVLGFGIIYSKQQAIDAWNRRAI